MPHSHGEFQRVKPADLKRMCVSAGLPFPDIEIDRLINTCPKDDEGKVSFEDFIVHLERSQMEMINGTEAEVTSKKPLPGIARDADSEQLWKENEKLKNTIEDLQEQLKKKLELPEPPRALVPEIPVEEPTEELVEQRITRKHNPNKGISNVFPDIDALPQIQTEVFAGRRKFKVTDPPTEDIFGNKINSSEKVETEAPAWTLKADNGRPKPAIDQSLLENIQACMDRNNKRALKDVTGTIDKWNGGSTMTKRMLTKIIKHSGLRLPNETVRLLFDKLDVYTDGTVALREFFQVFKDAENAPRQGGHDPAQISRNRRAEMQNRAAPWATM